MEFTDFKVKNPLIVTNSLPHAKEGVRLHASKIYFFTFDERSESKGAKYAKL